MSTQLPVNDLDNAKQKLSEVCARLDSAVAKIINEIKDLRNNDAHLENIKLKGEIEKNIKRQSKLLVSRGEALNELNQAILAIEAVIEEA